MDTGEYDTNILLINNVSAVRFRFFEPVAANASSFPSTASDVEAALRSEGNLVHHDPNRRGLWHFSLIWKDGAAESSSAPERLGSTVETNGVTLSMAEEGSFEPSQLSTIGRHVYTTANTPGSSSGALAVDMRASSASQPSSQNTAASGALDQNQSASAAETRGPLRVTLRELYELFIASLLAAVSSKYCSRTGAIPLNARTLVFLHRVIHRECQDRSHETSLNILATLRVYLTTAGALVLGLSLSLMEGLSTLSDPLSLDLLTQGSVVLAAPFGVFANYRGVLDTEYPTLEGGLAQSPDTQISRVRVEPDEKFAHWRSTLTKILGHRGVPCATIDTSSWLSLQLLRMKLGNHRPDGKRTPSTLAPSTISWPASLCFRKRTTDVSMSNRLGETMIISRAENYDPLSGVKTWFTETDERDERLKKMRKERAAREALERANNQANGSSPVALQRTNAAAAAAAGAIYPTPPDGVNPIGATPSMDGTVSTPGNPPNAAAAINAAGEMEDFATGWEGTETKHDRGLEPSTLFGEMETDIFGDADVTDADFNFFDDQPGELALDDLTEAADLRPHPSGRSESSQHDLKHSSRPTTSTGDEGGQATAREPIFAKPELKHARSSLNEESRQHVEPQETTPQKGIAAGIKRQPSPFSPELVYKRVRASLGRKFHPSPKGIEHFAVPNQANNNVFEKVVFDPYLSAEDRKYEFGGRFDCTWTGSKDEQMSDSNKAKMPPRTEYLRRHGKGNRKPKMLPSAMGSLFARITLAGLDGPAAAQQSPAKLEDPPSDADDVSLVSDQDDESVSTDEPASPVKSSGFLRNRLDDDAGSMATSLKDLETVETASPYSSQENPRFPRTEHSEVSLARYFADPEPNSARLALPDEDFITIAQILTEQAATGSLSVPGEPEYKAASVLGRRDMANLTRRCIDTLASIVSQYVGSPTGCQFKPYLDIADAPVPGHPLKAVPRQVPGNRDGGSGMDQLWSSPYQIPPPHLEVRRADSKLSLMPSAIGFWESLGLGPAQGAKDVYSVCVFPSWDGMADSAGALLDRLRSVYESLKLGTYERLPTTKDVADGLLAYELEKISTAPEATTSRSVLSDRMGRLCQALAAQPAAVGRNFVIYFVYSAEHASSIVESCAAFQQLFELCRKTAKQPVLNELVLQLVSMDFLASPTAVAVPTPAEFIRLSLETYDRCTLFPAGGGAGALSLSSPAAPAVVLEPPQPRLVEFRLTATPSASLLDEGACIHIAYAQSVDERWVTAAWTDSSGARQMTASYCLGRKGKPLSRPMTDVAHEIWESTHDLIAHLRVHWRVVVAKVGHMDAQELQFWSDLAQTESKAAMTLTLVTVDTAPALQLLAPQVRVPASAPALFYSTPVSTPQPASVVLSPEQSGGGGGGAPSTPVRDSSGVSVTTPGGGMSAAAAASSSAAANDPPNPAVEPDPDATLIEVADQTWGAVLAHRLNGLASLVDLQPALVSGYLLKRGGARPEDPPVAIEVSVLYVGGSGGAGLAAAGGGGAQHHHHQQSAMGLAVPARHHSGHHGMHHGGSQQQQQQYAAATSSASPPYEILLREILGHFRNLGALARARGVTDKEADVRPWHVAAVEKANRALYFLM